MGTKASKLLLVGELYTRNALAQKFGIKDATLRTGIFHPKGYDSAWLFLTEKKTPDRTQYHDKLQGNTLYMDGKTSGRDDDLIINHDTHGIELLLFYRERRDAYPAFAFRYEGPFRYVSHKGVSPTRFVLQRVAPASARAPRLALVRTWDEVRLNIRRFNQELDRFPARARRLLRQTSYWVFDPDENLFGPSKFVGYKSMTFNDYELAVDRESMDAAFDGHLTRQDIERIGDRRFAPDSKMVTQLRKWGQSALGQDVFDGLDHSKWRFIRLPPTRRYWVFFANPRIYDVESAMKSVDRDTWTTKKSAVRKGDRAILWRGMKDGKRGVVGFAEIISNPKIMPEPSLSRPFYVGHAPDMSERRVWMRIFKPPRAPLWIEDDDTGLLRTLSVANARGGTVFRLMPEQWHSVVEILGGWNEDSEEKRILWAVQSASGRARGQGFKVPPETRREIEMYAISRAEKHFRNLGYDVQRTRRAPFDLLCNRGTEELHVEVKGTQSKGERIVLTSGEVKHARKNPEHMALYVQYGVQVIRRAGKPVASGGKRFVKLKWNVDEGSLEPIHFFYKWA